MLDPASLLVVVVAFTLLLPITFLVVVVYAGGRRRRGLPIGSRLTSFLTVLGGMTIGIFLLTGADELLVAGPILGAAAILLFNLWRRRQRVQAGQIILGTSLPWTVLFTAYLVGMALHPAGYDAGAVVTWFAVGAAGIAVGLALIARGNPTDPPPAATAAAGEPGSRAFGSISAAIRDAGRVGPFGASELAAVVGFIVGWLLVPLLVPPELPAILRFAIPVAVGAVLGTEAYIRAMPDRSRRAFEAFSWLGEWELAQARAVARGSVPTSPGDAAEWLGANPETADNRWIRVEVLQLAGRFDEAREAAGRLPDATPDERFVRAEALDAIDWRSGGTGDLDAIRAAAAEIVPVDGDPRLRAEVTIATAEVRRRMADGRTTPGDALEPLLEVRRKLGRRADGQVGRALRRRLLTATLLAGFTLGGLLWLLNPFGGG